MTYWYIGLGSLALCFLAPLGVFAWWQRDPHCAKCGRRDWSKGVPAWRCRSCGSLHISAAARRALAASGDG